MPMKMIEFYFCLCFSRLMVFSHSFGIVDDKCQIFVIVTVILTKINLFSSAPLFVIVFVYE